ncbi:MAG: hypothetical protein IPK19_22740 [Chloroflexi bacterium]|nr:hypothetical protein [Chloroflexota bacterium]
MPFLYSIWSPDGSRAVSSAADGKIYVWQNGQVERVFAQHTAPVRRFVWNAATNLIASGDASGRVLVWNPTTGEAVRELVGHTGAILDLDWRADGTQLVTTSLDNTMRVWAWPLGEGQIVASGELISAVAYNPDGSELAFGGEIDNPDEVRIEIVSVQSLIPAPPATAGRGHCPAPTSSTRQMNLVRVLMHQADLRPPQVRVLRRWSA